MHLPLPRRLGPPSAALVGFALLAGCAASATTSAPVPDTTAGTSVTTAPPGSVVVAAPGSDAATQIGCLSTGTTPTRTVPATTKPVATKPVATTPTGANGATTQARFAPASARAFTTTTTSPAPPTPTSSAPPAADATTGSAAVWAEIQHELATYTSSDYQHTTTIDRGDGTYIVDCSGWGDVLLRIAGCDAYGDLVRSANATRGTAFSPSCALTTGEVDHGPYAVDWADLLTALTPGSTNGHWTRVATVAELAPGDVVTYALGAGAEDTGHVMFVAGTPTVDPQDPSRWRVPIADSTSSEHGPDDSRVGNPRNTDGKGIGQAAIELIVDASGAPTNQFRWYPGAPIVDQIPAPVMLGRLS